MSYILYEDKNGLPENCAECWFANPHLVPDEESAEPWLAGCNLVQKPFVYQAGFDSGRQKWCPLSGVSDVLAGAILSGKARKVCDLTDAEIARAVKLLFHADSYKNVKRYKKKNLVTLVITTEWESEDPEKPIVIDDDVELSDPWDDEGVDAGDYPVDSQTMRDWKEFCMARGIVPAWMLRGRFREV